ncbi:MAG: 4-phosphoerythronate dehydrogenase [Bacteroidales bacterium]|nr:4-phosphoerythronate dehydrogenase [Bacteroidales bacterium]MCF8404236.1 4-phosphoerythronate dehydrogenase [Bacteroidales bacterium]
MKIVADDKIPFLKGVLEPFAKITYLPGDQINKPALQNAEALLIRSITICDEELLSGTRVKLIASATIGSDHIDKRYCQENGIAWTTANGCNADAVAQYFTSALLHMAQNRNIRLAGKTLGIIGVGNIGKRVKKIAELLGMNILLNDPPREDAEGKGDFVSLIQIQKEADFISFHVPLTFGGDHKTFHLADDIFWKGFKKPIHLFNTSRGAVVDTEGLMEAQTEGIIKSVVLDVWENEPEIDLDLLEASLIGTPHIAGYSLEGKANSAALTVQSVSSHFGLGINSWTPAIPEEKIELEFDGAGLDDQAIFYRIFKQVYPILDDDRMLRKDINNFERIRRDYNFRRDNGAFALRLANVSSTIEDRLKQIGFNIL